jgi:hypothetical protein
MERFTERDVELWRKWMDAEFEYGVKKYGHEDSLALVSLGAIDAPVNSWSSQADRYLFEALQSRVLMEELGELPSKAKENVARAFGKYAANHIAFLTYALSEFYSEDPMLMHEKLLDRFGQGLNGYDPEIVAKRFLSLDEGLKDFNRSLYASLQVMQGAGELDGFTSSLTAGTYVSQAGFIVVSNEFGWPEPAETT